MYNDIIFTMSKVFHEPKARREIDDILKSKTNIAVVDAGA
jgi:hypothetical protein